jgi:hypothetical protein
MAHQHIRAGRGNPTDLDRSDRLRQSLEFQQTNRRERMSAASADQHPHDLRGQDLATARRCTQPRCFHHRRAEEIAVVDIGFAGAHTHSNRKRLVRPSIARLETLLHINSAAQCRTCTRECDH